MEQRHAGARPGFPMAAAPERLARVLPPVKIRIPAFPALKPLVLEDQYEIEQWVKRFAPYSDFNFVSLWSWNAGGQTAVSWLGDNLVVRFEDYATGAPFFSLIGLDDVDAAAARLLGFAREHGITEALFLVPEVTALAISDRATLAVVAAPEHADYVLAVKDWVDLPGKQFRNKRHEIHHFKRTYAPDVREIDLGNDEVQRAVDDVLGRWIVGRTRAGQADAIREAVAIRRVFALHRPSDLLGLGCFVNGRMVAFSINERLANGYAMGHFWKAAPSFEGAYPVLLHHTCRVLDGEGFIRLDIQQDLGTPGLARAKQLYRPRAYLPKYSVVPACSALADAGAAQVRAIRMIDAHETGGQFGA